MQSNLTGKLNAIGLLAFAAAIAIEVAGGIDLYPTIPPGIILCLLVAGLVFLGVRWRWTTIVGALFPLWLGIGGLLNLEGWITILTYPSAVVVAAGIMQLAGLMLALVAGIIAVWQAYRPSATTQT